jgi:predicted ribosomally synthesized peptide with SipW-like signal peptide
MTKSKHTKRALLASSLSVLLCLAMLVGLTFAWFTDTATTSVNTIESGTLVVDLVDGQGASLDGKTLNFVKAEGHANEPLLWEPGCTYSLPAVYVKNNGNLALKYKLMISGIVGDAKLLEAIDWTIKVGDDVITDLATFKGNLAAGEKSSNALVLSGHMREAAGNEFQGLSIDGIAITVTATQDTVEYDSTTDQYDTAAEYDVYDVTDNDSLDAAIAQGGIITLPVSDNQVTLGNNQAIGGDTVIDMSGSSQPIQNSIKVEDGKSLTMSNGTLKKNGTFGKIRFDNEKGLDSEGETQAGIFNDMTFKNTKGSVTDMVQIVPRGDSTGKYIFRNCHFIDANVVINGLSGDEYGDNGQVEIVFENCTFDINGWPAINFSSNYCTGSMTVKDCTFNMTTPAGFSAAIQAGGSKALSLTFAGTNYINNNGANTVYAFMPGPGPTVTGKNTIETTGTVNIP